MNSYLPILPTLLGLVVAAILSERALKTLTVEQKAQVIDAFSRARVFRVLVVVGIALVVPWWPLLAWILLTAFFVGAAIWGTRKYEGLRLPQPAKGYFVTGLFAVAGGVVVSAALVVSRSSLW